MNQKPLNPADIKPGDRVLYRPRPSGKAMRFEATVATAPWPSRGPSHHKVWLCRIEGLGEDYRAAMGGTTRMRLTVMVSDLFDRAPYSRPAVVETVSLDEGAEP